MPGVPEVCSIISHELRTPLTVLQGYLRLIQRGSGPPNPAHVSAMLDATAQLAAVGRQASDLSGWLRDFADTPPGDVLPVASFLDALRRSAASAHPVELVIDTPAATGDHHLALRGGPDPLARAVVAVATAVARHAETTDARLLVAPPPTRLTLDIRAEAPAAPADLSVPRMPGDERPWYMSGGFGLALVSSVMVLEASGGQVQWLPGQRAAIVSLPLDGRS